MIEKIQHPVASLVIFAIVVSIAVGVYSYGLQDGYGVEPDGLDPETNQSIVEEWNNLLIIQSMNDITSGIFKLKDPTGNLLDVVGGLLSAGIGILKLVPGLLIFPVQILVILAKFYTFPPILIVGIALIISIYIGFLILAFYLQSGGKI